MGGGEGAAPAGPRGHGRHPGREMMCVPASTNITALPEGREVSGRPGEVASQPEEHRPHVDGRAWVPVLFLLPARSVT